MNILVDLATQLKAKGFNQQLTRFDTAWLTKAGHYERQDGQITDEYVRVPSFTQIMNELFDVDYALAHQPLGNDKDKWTLNAGDFSIEDENPWVVMAKFWLLKKGK